MKIKPTAVPDKCIVAERGFKDDSKIFGLNNWKGRVARQLQWERLGFR